MSQDNKEEKSEICIRSELYEELMKEAEEKLYNVNEHIENIIDRHLNRNKMISKMWPGLQIAMVEKNAIVVINISERKFFDVKLHENLSFVNRTNQQDVTTLPLFGCKLKICNWIVNFDPI